ncbi:hypothetical protein J6590_006441 [Homalodisca vitripennis]|nr:hypothetical protein J6590_006441 [Homalodisca vitripennis]
MAPSSRLKESSLTVHTSQREYRPLKDNSPQIPERSIKSVSKEGSTMKHGGGGEGSGRDDSNGEPRRGD